MLLEKFQRGCIRCERSVLFGPAMATVVVVKTGESLNVDDILLTLLSLSLPLIIPTRNGRCEINYEL